MQSDLRGYQKQALGWMRDREELVHDGDKLGQRLHPSWREQDFAADADGKWYWNVTNGILTTNFPSAESESRGGLLADGMGLGKTVEMLSLIASLPAPAAFLDGDDATPQAAPGAGHGGAGDGGDGKPKAHGKAKAKASPGAHAQGPAGGSGVSKIFTTNFKPRASDHGSATPRTRATLIIAPMSLIEQWKDEVLQHTFIPASNVLVYYGDTRGCGLTAFCDHDIIITT